MLNVIAKEDRWVYRFQPRKIKVLTKGKEYEVESEDIDSYNIRDDTGELHSFYKWRFLGCDTCKDRHCNSCKIMESVMRGLEDAKAGRVKKLKLDEL
jgi:hypothetical protein